MSTVLRDLRYALRAMWHAPSFALIAILCLGLGIGATSTIFGIVDVLFFRPPEGVADPGSIVRPYIERDTGMVQTTAGGNDRVAFPDYVDIRDNARTLSGLAAFTNVALSVGRGDDATSADGMEVTGNYFGVLGVRPALGRFFGSDEDAGAGSPPAVVVSHDYWQRTYGGDHSILGKSMLIDGHEYPIVGVAPDDFHGVDPGSIDLWITFAQDAKLGHSETALTTRSSIMYQTVGRLRPGETRESAGADVEAILRHAAESTPGFDPTPEVKMGPILSARGPVPSNQAKLSLWLAAASVLLLAIACMNTSNLLLARAATRQREIAIRLSIGASRARIVRQLLTESMLLALFGAALGVLIASWGIGMIPAEGLPRLDFFARGRVLGFAVAAAVTCSLFFGLAPALWSTRADLAIAMKQGVREGVDRHSRIRSILMSTQVALAVVLLSGAGLFVHSLRNVQEVDPGFDLDHMLRVAIDLRTAGYTDTATAQFYERAVDALRETPGIRGAAVTTMTPLSGSMSITGFSVPGVDDASTADPTLNLRRMMSGNYPISVTVGPEYFAATGTPVLQGRDFGAADRGGSSPVAIVNQSFASHYWPSESPVGKCIDIGTTDSAKCHTVVGVVANARYVLIEEADRQAFFLPITQLSGSHDRYILVRTTADPSTAIGTVRTALQRLDARLPYANIQTMSDVLRPQLQPRRLGAAMFGAFGVLALALAAIGLYGVISYAVSQRTHEVGIRLALGAQPAQVLRLVVRQGVVLTVIGLVIGIVAALAGSRLITHFLFGVDAADPITFVGVCVALGAVAALASYIPARRAARVDPIEALRTE